MYFEQVINIEFPQYLLETFKNEYILEDTFAKLIFVEYAKFLVMIKLNDCDIGPGFWVDMLWHTHMQYTKMYRDFCYSFFGKVVGHLPNNDCITNKDESKELHKNTLQVYAKMFGPSINSQIWCDLTYANTKNCLVNVNLLIMLNSYAECQKKAKSKGLFSLFGKFDKPEVRHF